MSNETAGAAVALTEEERQRLGKEFSELCWKGTIEVPQSPRHGRSAFEAGYQLAHNEGLKRLRAELVKWTESYVRAAQEAEAQRKNRGAWLNRGMAVGTQEAINEIDALAPALLKDSEDHRRLEERVEFLEKVVEQFAEATGAVVLDERVGEPMLSGYGFYRVLKDRAELTQALRERTQGTLETQGGER